MDDWIEGFIHHMTLNAHMSPNDARAIASRLYRRIYFLSGHDAAELLLKSGALHSVEHVDPLRWER